MPRIGRFIGQFEWNEGMNLLAAPNRLSKRQARVLRNIDIRSGQPFRSKGKSLFNPAVEVGTQIYDLFMNTDVDVERWRETDLASGSVSIESTTSGPRLSIAGSGTIDETGLVSKQAVGQDRTGAYAQLDLTTPAVTTGAFRVGLYPTSTTLASGDGLEIEFDSSGNINRLEDGVSTDTTQDYVASKKYRIKLIKLAVGWEARISSLSDTTFDNVQLFTTTFEGNNSTFLGIQATSETWKVNNVLFHEGYANGSKLPVRSTFRFYRVDQPAVTIAATDDALLDVTEDGWSFVRRGYSLDKRWDFTVARGLVYAANGVDDLQRRAAGTWEDVTGAPVLTYVEEHLERIFGAHENTLYWSDFISHAVWDTLDDVVDMESWKGDKITRLVRVGPILYIFKSRSVWQLLGTVRDNFQLRKLAGAVGCPYPWSIASNGTDVFYRGADGFYRLQRGISSSISIPIQPVFTSGSTDVGLIIQGNENSSVGVVHEFRYRCSVEMTNQNTSGYNNVEWVYDTITAENGAWSFRTNRHIDCYEAYDGHGDTNKLVAGNSNSDGGFYLMENDFRETKSQFNAVDAADSQDINVASLIETRYEWGDDPLTKNDWHDFRLHFFENGVSVVTTVTWHTNRHTDGSTISVTHNSVNDLSGTSLDLTAPGTLLANFYARGKNLPDQIESGKNDGEEIWFDFENSGTTDWRIFGYEVELEDTNQ